MLLYCLSAAVCCVLWSLYILLPAGHNLQATQPRFQTRLHGDPRVEECSRLYFCVWGIYKLLSIHGLWFDSVIFCVFIPWESLGHFFRSFVFVFFCLIALCYSEQHFHKLIL